MSELYKKYRILIIAILIAALLWLFVNYQEGNLKDSFVFRNNSYLLDIKYEKLSDDFIVSSISSEVVQIELKGYRFFNTYSKRDFKAYLDLSDVQIGDNIRLVKINAPQNLNIKSINPELIRITVRKKEKTK
ncbi:MAG: hypothetical protein K9K32_01260 [Halanaerobiales bacterium]|nr:hypothetical protein [Halanaerobiales bacterium]